MYKDKNKSQGFRAMEDTSMFQKFVSCPRCNKPVSRNEPHIQKGLFYGKKRRYHKSCFDAMYIGSN